MYFKTFRYHYKPKDDIELRMLRFLTHISKNVYNVALYTLRDNYFKGNNNLSYFDLNKIVLKNINAYIINTYQSLCISRCAYNAFNNFIKYQYKDNVKLPAYLSKRGFYPLITDQIRIINGRYIKLPLSNLVRTKKIFSLDFNNDSLILEFLSSLKDVKNICFKIPKNIIDCKIHQVRIIPCYNGEYFNIEFSYSKEDKIDSKTNKGDILGIDIGVTNLFSCSTIQGKTFIIDGKYLKSINTLYNKKLSRLKSKLPKGTYTSKLIRRTLKNRNNKINDYISKAVNKTIFKMKELNISKVIIGWNKYIKNGGVKNNKLTNKQLSKVNQHFVGLPLSKLKDKLIYKAKQIGIEITIINESYTSKASALDNDKFNNELPFNGKRITRGLYKTSNNNIINADINAALNMIRKCNSNEDLNIQMSRGLTSPRRIYVYL